MAERPTATEPDQVSPSEQLPRWLRLTLLALIVLWVVLGIRLLFTPPVAHPWLTNRDSLGHVLLFAIFGGLLAALVGLRSIPKLALALGAAIVVMVLVEIFQPLIDSSRNSDIGDISAGLIGLFGGGAAVLLLSRIRRRPVAMAVAAAALAASPVAQIISGGNIAPLETRWQCRDSSDQSGLDPIAGVPSLPVFLQTSDGRQVAGDPNPVQDGPIASDETMTLACALVQANAFTIIVDIESQDLSQRGPTRIVSLSEGTSTDQINLQIGQDGDGIDVRILVGNSYLFGETSSGVVSLDQTTQITVTYDNGSATLYVDEQTPISLDLPYDTLYGWHDDFVLLVGDELSRDRTFVGEIGSVAIFPAALSPQEVANARVFLNR